MKKKYPQLIDLINNIVASARKRSYTYSLFGRKLFVEKGKEYKIINNFVQSTFSDLFQYFIFNIDGRLRAENLNSYILYSIHDEILMDVNTSENNKFYEIINNEITLLSETMKNDYGVNINLLLDIKNNSTK
jgi:DNA polymerase I-like protein with 3'-5' exonuclease and polymerase domains